MKIEELWLWRWRFQWNKRWCTNCHSCTHESILKQHPEAIRIEGTLITRIVHETQAEQHEALYCGTTGRFQVLSKSDS